MGLSPARYRADSIGYLVAGTNDAAVEIEADLIMPSQFAELFHGAVQFKPSPLGCLYTYVMLHALEDAFSRGRLPSAQRQRAEAIEWLTIPDPIDNTFGLACTAIGLQAEAVREHVRRRLAAAEQQQQGDHQNGNHRRPRHEVRKYKPQQRRAATDRVAA